MTPELKKLSEELQSRLSLKQISELAYDLEVKAKDEYYKQHPEEITNANYSNQ